MKRRRGSRASTRTAGLSLLLLLSLILTPLSTLLPPPIVHAESAIAQARQSADIGDASPESSDESIEPDEEFSDVSETAEPLSNDSTNTETPTNDDPEATSSTSESFVGAAEPPPLFVDDGTQDLTVSLEQVVTIRTSADAVLYYYRSEGCASDAIFLNTSERTFYRFDPGSYSFRAMLRADYSIQSACITVTWAEVIPTVPPPPTATSAVPPGPPPLFINDGTSPLTVLLGETIALRTTSDAEIRYYYADNCLGSSHTNHTSEMTLVISTPQTVSFQAFLLADMSVRSECISVTWAETVPTTPLPSATATSSAPPAPPSLFVNDGTTAITVLLGETVTVRTSDDAEVRYYYADNCLGGSNTSHKSEMTFVLNAPETVSFQAFLLADMSVRSECISITWAESQPTIPPPTAIQTATEPISTDTATVAAPATELPTPTATNTPTATETATSEPTETQTATSTPAATETATSAPPTPTQTATTVPTATATQTPAVTRTSTPTATTEPPTPTDTATSEPTATATANATVAPPLLLINEEPRSITVPLGTIVRVRTSIDAVIYSNLEGSCEQDLRNDGAFDRAYVRNEPGTTSFQAMMYMDTSIRSACLTVHWVEPTPTPSPSPTATSSAPPTPPMIQVNGGSLPVTVLTGETVAIRTTELVRGRQLPRCLTGLQQE